jgi:hypothetical protein
MVPPNDQGLAAALRASPTPQTFGLVKDFKRRIASILPARSAVGYNPLFGGNRSQAFSARILQTYGSSPDLCGYFGVALTMCANTQIQASFVAPSSWK